MVAQREEDESENQNQAGEAGIEKSAHNPKIVRVPFGYNESANIRKNDILGNSQNNRDYTY